MDECGRFAQPSGQTEDRDEGYESGDLKELDTNLTRIRNIVGHQDDAMAQSKEYSTIATSSTLHPDEQSGIRPADAVDRRASEWSRRVNIHANGWQERLRILTKAVAKASVSDGVSTPKEARIAAAAFSITMSAVVERAVADEYLAAAVRREARMIVGEYQIHYIPAIIAMNGRRKRHSPVRRWFQRLTQALLVGIH